MEQTKDHSMEQTILRAAERLFLEKGSALTSTTEIAKEAGCNQALVHYYFRTKEQLFLRVFEEKVKMFAEAFFSIETKGGTFLERLKRKIEVHFDLVSKNPQIPFLILNEITTNPDRIKAIREKVSEFPQRILQQVGAELEEAIARGEVRQITLLDLVLTILSLNIFPFLIRPLLEQIVTLSEEELNAQLLRRRNENVELVLRGLRP